MNVARLNLSSWGEPQLNNWFPVRSFLTPDGNRYEEIVLGRPTVKGLYPVSIWFDRDEPPVAFRSWKRWMSRGVENVRPTLKGTTFRLKAPNAIVSDSDLEMKGAILLGYDTHYGSPNGDGDRGFFSVQTTTGTHQELAFYNGAYEAGFMVICPGFRAHLGVEHTGDRWNVLYPSQDKGVLLKREEFVGHTDVHDVDFFARRMYPFA